MKPVTKRIIGLALVAPLVILSITYIVRGLIKMCATDPFLLVVIVMGVLAIIGIGVYANSEVINGKISSDPFDPYKL